MLSDCSHDFPLHKDERPDHLVHWIIVRVLDFDEDGSGARMWRGQFQHRLQFGKMDRWYGFVGAHV